MVSAVESLSDTVLAHLDKGHTRADIADRARGHGAAGIALRPTLVAFTPWTTLDDYPRVLDFLAAAGLIDHVDPVQSGLRLLVPPGSLLLETEALRRTWARSSRRRSPTAGRTPTRAWTGCRRRRAQIVAQAVEVQADAPGHLRPRARDGGGSGRRSTAPAPLRGEIAKGRRPARLSEAWFC